MPRYDFKCRTCGVTFEAITPSDISALPCTQCVNIMNNDIAVERPGYMEFGVSEIKHLADRQLSAPANIYIH